MKALLAWLDDRTGYEHFLKDALYERVPFGARWRYVTGSMLVFAFVTQMVTGAFLWMAYSPSSQTAWESVYYIQYEMTGGWLLRGIHHFTAQAMMVVLGLHLLQVMVDGAYRAPREFNYWLGLILMQLVLALGLTGYLLPWDQKGYWATNVATTLMTLVPFVGKEIQALALGGPDYGHHTLTRFFALHAGVLPFLMLVFLGLHIALFRKHGLHALKREGRPDDTFFPKQVALDAIASVLMLLIVLLCVVHWDVVGLFTGTLSSEHLGAELGAPADASEPYGAARPEWYFLFLFQLLKYFDGSTPLTSEFIGAIVLPGIIFGVMFMAPLIARVRGGHAFNVAFLLVLLVGAGALTGIALYEDSQNKQYQHDVAEAHESAERVVELVQRSNKTEEGEGDPMLIPQVGALSLLRNDPGVQGPKLFGRHCASCHNYAGPNKSEPRFVITQDPEANLLAEGETEADRTIKLDAEGNPIYADTPTAPNLYGFASRDWIRGILNPKQIVEVEYPIVKSFDTTLNESHPAKFIREIRSPYFGNTAHKDGRMVDWVKDHLTDLPTRADKEDAKLTQDDIEDIVIALSAQAKLPSQREADAADAEKITNGVALLKSTCATHCHKFGDEGQTGLAPDLTGYGSFEWMMGFVSNPSHERFYRSENDRMPAFADNLEDPADNQVTWSDLGLIVDWLRGDYYQKSAKSPTFAHSSEEANAAVLLALNSPTGRKVIGEEISAGAAIRLQAESLFRTRCSQCHSHVDKFGAGIAAAKPSGPNLYGFASRDWLTGLLEPDRVAGPEYFGNTAHFEGDMASFVNDSFAEPEEETKTMRELVIIALSAEAKLPTQTEADEKAIANGDLEKGIEAFTYSFDGGACSDCHTLGDIEDGSDGPNLTGYGSAKWIAEMISNPNAEKYYGENNDRMPIFHFSKEYAEAHPLKQPLLTKPEVALLSVWLRGVADEDLAEAAGEALDEISAED